MTNQRTKAAFDFGAAIDPPEHLALAACLGNMCLFLRPGEVARTLHRLLLGVGLANGDPYPWELVRWRERWQSIDEEDPEHSLDDNEHPDINPDHFLAWCDPFDFGAENFWGIYTEAELKDCLAQAFTHWAKKDPSRRAEYTSALATHGMHLR